MTAEELYSILAPIAGKWEELGAKLGLDEDYIDEVFTNNETDLLCFQNMLEDSCRHHTWTSVGKALLDIGETELAEKCIQTW